jgi:Reverse transcriptase (RNA-dependent DNA polymerase)
MANGLAEILPNRIFRVRVVNGSLTDRLLPKGMILCYAMPHPTGIVSVVEQEAEPLAKNVHLGLQVALSPEEYAMGMDTPPLPDRPDVEGALWKQDVDLAHLTPQEREKMVTMLGKHRTRWDGRLGQVHTTAHRIQLTPGAKPAYSQPYRAGDKAREAESVEIHRMLRAGVIEPATSERASPVVLVPKPDGSMRFCIDYRRLNTVTVRDSYPLPRMDECIDSLGDARVFSTLDFNSGYWQIPVSPKDKEKTIFTSHEGLFQFFRMPFGMWNAPATFQRFVDITLAGLTWKVCLVYLDDIIVHSRSREDHLAHLDAVLHRLYRAGLSLNLKKCHFFRSEVSYLGHVIGPWTLSVSEKNTQALRTAKPPTTQTELRSFLGLCNVYRRFVSGFAKIAALLNALLRKRESP